MKLVVGDLNSRIHNNTGGEGEIFGEFCFGNPLYNPQQKPNANRELLLEMCVARGLCVANTFLENEAEHLVTYYDIGKNPVADITHQGFAQLDLMLCPLSELWQIKQLRSDRWEALATHHFLLEAVVEIRSTNPQEISREGLRMDPMVKTPRYDYAALSHPQVNCSFANRFAALANDSCPSSTSCDELSTYVC